MDGVCTPIGDVPGHGYKYTCVSQVVAAETERNCHAAFNLPLGSSLRSIDHLHVYLRIASNEPALTNVRVWALKVGQGNIGQGDHFFLSWTLHDARIIKSEAFKQCTGPYGALMMTAEVYVDPPKK